MIKIYERLLEGAIKDGAKPALTEYLGKGEYRTLSRAELAALSATFADYWTGMTEEGDIVPIFLERSAVCVAAILGAIGAQRAFACINRKNRVPQLHHILGLLPGRLILTDQQAVDLVATEHLQYPKLAERSWRIAPARLNAQGNITLLGMEGIAPGISELILPIKALIPRVNNVSKSSEPGCCLFTSGSTGEAKGVLISQSDLFARAEAEVNWFELTENDILLGLLPFSFDVGLNQLLSAILAGTELVLIHSWMPADVRRVCEERGVTGISSVPALWRDQIASEVKLLSTSERKSLRYVTISGGGLDPVSLAKLPQIVPGAGIYKTYGQTETFRSSSLHPTEFAARPSSVGRPFGKSRFYVIDEDGSICKPGVSGHIVHTGPGTMLGYIDRSLDEGKIRENPFLQDGDPFSTAVYTGDYGFVDEHGYLYVEARKDEMVKIKGNRVYPQEVASQIMLISGASAVEVVVVQNDIAEHDLVAFVIPCILDEDSATIFRNLRKRLPSYMAPSKIVTCRSLPKMSNGKTDRQALEARAKEVLVNQDC